MQFILYSDRYQNANHGKSICIREIPFSCAGGCAAQSTREQKRKENNKEHDRPRKHGQWRNALRESEIVVSVLAVRFAVSRTWRLYK